MKKSFVLVTRSYKYGGYCIAGFDAETKKWIRLVSCDAPSGNEIPKIFFARFDDLDILEVETRGQVSCGCQTENYLLDCTVPPVRRGRLSFYELLSPAYVETSPMLFGNTLAYLTEEEIARQQSSLGLFNAGSLVFDYTLGDDGKMHYRCGFVCGGKPYAGISVTDPIYRKDEFAGQTIERALIAVSLPAIPYPNGKYYKFVAKIFPLTEAEAARIGTFLPTVQPLPAPRDSREASDTPRAVRFLLALSEGRDPDTDGALDPARILSPSFASRLRECAELLGGKSKKRAEKKVYLLQKNLDAIEPTDGYVTASMLRDRVNAVREPYGKNLTAVAVIAVFLAAGLIEEDEEHKHKIPTPLGKTYGVISEARVSANGIHYTIVLYGRAAQQFFLDNIGSCAEILDAPLPTAARQDVGTARGYRFWDAGEEEVLAREYSSGVRIEEIAKRHKRTIAAVAKRLRRLGLME